MCRVGKGRVGGGEEKAEGERGWLFYTLVLDTKECVRQGLTCCLGNTLYKRDMSILMCCLGN